MKSTKHPPWWWLLHRLSKKRYLLLLMHFFQIYLIKICLIYNFVLISAEQQNDSVTVVL